MLHLHFCCNIAPTKENTNMKNPTLISVITALIYVSCTPKDPDIVNPEEVITTFTYTLSPTSGNEAVVLKFYDADGDGGKAPVITVSGPLTSNGTYHGSIELANELSNPVDNITKEVTEEGIDHQFFFAFTDGLNTKVTYTDHDSNGNPIGLMNDLTTGKASKGTITITLRHQPDKTGKDVKTGDITNAGGETDIEVSFEIEVQ